MLKSVIGYCTILTVALTVLNSCGGQSSRTKFRRDFHPDAETPNGLVYGKIIHNNYFGKRIAVTFKNRVDNSTFSLTFEGIGGYGEESIFTEFAPGDWVLGQIIGENSETVHIHDLKKDEHREFIVERGKITYIGTWIFFRDSMSVENEKYAQDQWMRRNYQYVLTDNALISLP
jgi:hypothetical protein